ncbi:MAG: RNA polymerase sigma factor [Ruminococcus sp.]|nr:RNA polymerase sigma factor [Ruminococcus sp.]
MQDNSAVEKIIEKYGDMLYRLCLIMLCVPADAEDAVQETVIAYFRKAPDFTDPEHEKAWLITVARNKCRSMQRFRRNHPVLSDEVLETVVQSEEDSRVIEALSELPEKFRLVLTLHYIEGFKVNEIAKMTGRTSSAVKMQLAKGRELLGKKYKEEYL